MRGVHSPSCEHFVTSGALLRKLASKKKPWLLRPPKKPKWRLPLKVGKAAGSNVTKKKI